MAGIRIGYGRVSTSTAEQAESIELQVQRLHAAGCDEVIADQNVSGFREKGRKGSRFPELVERILNGEVAQVVVTNFDRTQRRQKWGTQLLDACERLEITILELDTGQVFDPANNPNDVLMAQLRTTLQENESRWRRIKVRNALRARRERGEYAHGKVPFGYAVVKGQVVPHPQHWKEARQRFVQLQELGFNCALWIKTTGATISPRGIKAWLVNPTLRGEVKNRPGMSCKPLISAEEWRSAKQQLEARATARGVGLNKTIHLFTGLVACECCGKNLHTCWDYPRRPHPRLKCLNRTCSQYGRGIRVSVVREAVIHALITRHAELADEYSRGLDHLPETQEMLQLREEIQQMEALAHVPGMEGLLAERKAKLNALFIQPDRREWREVSDLFQDPATFRRCPDEVLRPVIQQLISRICWGGGITDSGITITCR